MKVAFLLLPMRTKPIMNRSTGTLQGLYTFDSKPYFRVSSVTSDIAHRYNPY